MNNEKIKASLVIGSYLDTLGFFNSQWEFNFGIPDYKITTYKDGLSVQANIVNHYFILGGSQLNLKDNNLFASDDTILMIATKKACLKGGSINDFIDEFLAVLPKLYPNKYKERNTGVETLKRLNELKKINKKNILNIIYTPNITGGGNGAAMRTSFIGLHYYKEEDVDKLIELSITSSLITHRNILGFLGGLITALFCSYAMRNIEPWKWIKKLLELDKNGTIDKFMKKTNIYKYYLEEKHTFFDFWIKYNEERLPSFLYKPKTFKYPINRYLDINKYITRNNIVTTFGKSGLSATIYAFDSLLCSTIILNKKKINELTNDDVKYSWESLIYFSTLHFGDNDTTGIIAGNWFGALTGFKYFDKNKINELEFKDEILQDL
jgi:ADP-ribosylarginine hydrolase